MVQVTVWPETGTPFCVTLTTREAGSGVPIVPVWLLPVTMVMTSGPGFAASEKVTEAPPGTDAVTWLVGAVGVSVLLAWPLALFAEVGPATVPPPPVHLPVPFAAPPPPP